MVLADRSTTSRWTPPRGERSNQVRPILEGKNRGRHFVRKTPSPESIAFGVRPRFAFDPTRTVAHAGQTKFNTGIAFTTADPSGATIALATNRASECA